MQVVSAIDKASDVSEAGVLERTLCWMAFSIPAQPV